MLGVEVGWRGLFQLALYSALPAIAVGFVKGYGQSTFDFHAFWTVFGVVTVVGVINNLLNQNLQFKKVLSPGAGRIWRSKRKAITAGIILRINRHVAHNTPSPSEVQKIIQDLLDVIVLHVRDHQGNFKDDRPRVFGNLLIEDGAYLVVVARDSISWSSSEYQRTTPIRYPKETMLCGRAITSRKVLSIGDLVLSYPEGPKTKPYRSILAIPLFSAQGDSPDVPYGALSIDCSEPYFFESFAPGQAENDLENSLQPYTQLITLILETLVSIDRRVMISQLAGSWGRVPIQGGQP
jgi:hypothetical protein